MTKADVARALSEAALEIEGMIEGITDMPRSEHFAHKNVIQLADEITRLLEENLKLKEMLGEAKSHIINHYMLEEIEAIEKGES